MADPRIALLRKVPLFAACDDKQLAFIATQVEELDFPAGHVLCRQGESGGEFFVILSGKADVTRDGRKIQELGAGDFFGEIALLDRGPRTATVTSTSPMRSLVLGQGQFRNVLGQNAAIAVAVLEALGRRIRPLLASEDF
jgi:CRP/FNR family cyclic AMP-dependent transcriptional regulator